ncbi:MAG: hypothetical protein AAFU79_09055 [Myxococcota bacterium]
MRLGLSALILASLSACATTPAQSGRETVVSPTVAAAEKRPPFPSEPPPGGAKAVPAKADCLESGARVEAVFARRYRDRHCPLCSRRAAVEPLALTDRKAPGKDFLARTAAGLRGPRKRVVLYYFMIPCAPCDVLLPDIQKVLAAADPRDLEVIPVMETTDDQLAEPTIEAEIVEKFPKQLAHLRGVFRDRAPFGKGLRKVARGVPATVVFSGPELRKVEVLYGAEQTRFWKREAAKVRPRIGRLSAT